MFFIQKPSIDATLSYLFGCGGKGKAIAIDVVAGDEDWFIETAKEKQVTITHVIDTHVHADHLSGGRELAKRINSKYCLHENANVGFEFCMLKNNDKIEIGNVSAKILHTPGHTMDSISILVSDNRRSNDPWFVVTGDTLFVGAIGRPDLAGKEEELAGILFDSLHEKLLTLPDNVEIYPGHQAGSACGAGISGKPSSTIGFEKQHNPSLQIQDRNEFIKSLCNNIPPKPANMDEIVAANISA